MPLYEKPHFLITVKIREFIDEPQKPPTVITDTESTKLDQCQSIPTHFP